MGVYIIFNADDFGFHEDINTGIIEVCEKGLVTNVSISACGQAFNFNEINRLKSLSDISFGIHLTLTQFKPVTDPSKLRTLITEKNNFYYHFSDFIKKYLMHKIDLNEVRLELENQIKKIIDSGIKISKIDGHQHIHMLPGIWKIVRVLSEKYNIRYIRRPFFHNIFRCPNKKSSVIDKLILNFLCYYSKKDRKLISADNIFGLSYSGFMDVDILKSILMNIPCGVNEIMFHPGNVTDRLISEFSRWNCDWRTEKESLLSDEIKDIIKDEDIIAVNYNKLVPEMFKRGNYAESCFYG